MTVIDRLIDMNVFNMYFIPYGQTGSLLLHLNEHLYILHMTDSRLMNLIKNIL